MTLQCPTKSYDSECVKIAWRPPFILTSCRQLFKPQFDLTNWWQRRWESRLSQLLTDVLHFRLYQLHAQPSWGHIQPRALQCEPGHESATVQLLYCLFAQHLPDGRPADVAVQGGHVCLGAAGWLSLCWRWEWSAHMQPGQSFTSNLYQVDSICNSMSEGMFLSVTNLWCF